MKARDGDDCARTNRPFRIFIHAAWPLHGNSDIRCRRPCLRSDLAAAEYVRPQSMAVTVASLVSAGLVRRTNDDVDKRRVIVSLTVLGREALESTRQTQGEWLAQVIVTELDEAEQRTLLDAVRLLECLADTRPSVVSGQRAGSRTTARRRPAGSSHARHPA